MALLWFLLCEQHSGLASPYEIGAKFDELFAWGTPGNPDLDGFDPATPATAEEKRAGAGLLALAKGG